ncbi:MAG: DoxX family protein [Kofleriaceae bacterium]
MKRITPVARVLLGLVFVVFAASYFFPFLPPQPMPPEPALALVGALVGSGLLTMVKTIELVAGLALLANRAVPLALAVLAPIIVGIVFFHVALAPAGAALALGVLALELVLAWSYRDAFRAMLRWRVAPAGVAVTSAAPSELAVARG